MDGRDFGLVTRKTLVILDRSRKKKVPTKKGDCSLDEAKANPATTDGYSRGERRLFPRRTTAICLRRLNKMANPHEPHFFKPLLPGFQSGVTIPLAFFSKHIEGKTNQKTWKLRSDASDQTWEVIQEDRTLTRGWKDFTTAHDLQIGDLVIFKHEGDMVFHVTPFGPSCCEIQYTHPHIIKEEADAGDADDNEIKLLEAQRVGREPGTGHLSFASVVKKGEVKEKKVIDMGKVHKMKREKVSAWTMRVLMEAVRTSGLSTISDTLDQTAAFGDGKEKGDRGEITSEMEALAAAYHVFRNVAQPCFNFIEEEDLLRFMIKEEVDLVFPLFDGAAETGKITRKAFTEWVVKVYTSRKALAHSLNDTKTAVKQLNKLVTAILMVVTLIIWLLLLEVATTKVLLFFSTQMVALAFIIGSTCKNLFESIIFVFVMHPYDVGDRCVVDGVPLLVEEMNLLSTVFLKLDNEKVYYPNAVLATKPISNYFRSPDMSETVEFSIAFSTPISKIAHLKERIADYLEQNPHHWSPIHTVVVKEIENMNKLKMALYSNHTITFQEYSERNIRRTEQALAIKKILEDLHIDYSLLPQHVHLTKSDKN
ncbi:hypothetical protein F2Q69_00000486 [Brassica cretica]|uniref:TF-B3 domain-containing protein n=1 Tax=Brassica cretica TaxID=69181 RepID=A0A8S9P6N6_BRACR|nr:hypothetical protein F2Q69_00000486 [Brassica cretica]